MTPINPPEPAHADLASRSASPRLRARVLAAQSAMVFERARLANLLGAPFGALICWLLWGKVAAPLLLLWLAAKLAVCLWRAGIDLAQRRAGPAEANRWLRHYQVAQVVDGLVYSAVGTWLAPDPSTSLGMMMTGIVIVTASVGFVVLSHHYATMLSFVLPLLLPVLAWQLWLGAEINLFASLAMLLFLLLVLVDGWRAAAHTAATLRVRYRMDELADQRRQALELAQQHSAVKSRFLATMSHEMRTPLHGMLGIARQLRSGPEPGSTGFDERLATLERAGEHLLGLINDVLDFSKIEGGHLRVGHAGFDLSMLVAEVVEWTRLAGAEKGLAVRLDSTLASPCWVRGDAARLRQVLLNLCGNALKFTDQGSIRLAVSRQTDGDTTITVVDTGCGFPAENVERLFEAFHQEDTSNMRRHGGTGLGLAISRELARLMGGDLQGTGAPGHGASFTLALPLPGTAPAAAPNPPPAPLPALRGRVLLVEDNPVNAIVAEAILARAGLAVDLATDGEQAVRRTADERFDVVLMDCQMPVLDGIEATRQIRQREGHRGDALLPIIGLTANASEEDRLACLSAGMDDFLVKPFREHQLHSVLARYLSPAC